MSDFAVMPITEYVDICDTIREKTGETSVIKSGEMPKKIGKVFEAGQKSEYDRFWDNLQVEGRRTIYYSFWQCTSTDDFYPKYDIKPTIARDMMRDMTGTPVDLVERLNECGIKLDMSNCTDLTYAFYNGNAETTSFSRLPEIDARKAGGTQRYYLFGQQTITIDKFYPASNGALTNTFVMATALENIVIGSEITQSGMRLENCAKLTHDSLMSFVNALKDYSADAGATYSATFGATNLAKLTDAEKTIATQKGWTLA